MTHQDHTPGPWEFSSPGPCPEAEPGIIFTSKPARLVGMADRDADVRLMAAAPELLERLTGLMHRLETIRETDKTGIALDQDIESARAVIKRAKPSFGLTMDELKSWASEKLKEVKAKVAARDLESENKRLKKALSELVGAETKEELEAMESAMRMMPGIEADKIAGINAIHALLDSENDKIHP
jgi:hypothetical protein